MIPAVLVKYLVGFIAIIGILFGVHVHGVSQGKKLESSVWLSKELVRTAAEKVAVAKSVADGLATFDKFETEKQKIIYDHLTELKTIRTVYDANTSRLRLPRASCSDTTTAGKDQVSGSSRANDAITETTLLPEQIDRDLRQLTRYADEVTAVARSLQALMLQCTDIKELPK